MLLEDPAPHTEKGSLIGGVGVMFLPHPSHVCLLDISCVVTLLWVIQVLASWGLTVRLRCYLRSFLQCVLRDVGFGTTERNQYRFVESGLGKAAKGWATG